MSSPASSPGDGSTPRAVFLSYAREDSAAAQGIAEAFRSRGVAVWFDQSELRGGDAWDQMIRRQIRDCGLFVPLVSAHTQSRGEGYFRLEWKLAVERSHLIADGIPFLAPVVIDETSEASAIAPAEFTRVQWTRLPGGFPTPQFVDHVQRLLGSQRLRSPTALATAFGPPPAAGKAQPARARWPWLAAGLAALLLAALLLPRPPSQPAATAEPAAKSSADGSANDRSVAVLAFVNMSADREAGYFSDGVSEEILNALANNPALRVTARTSSFSFKDKNVPIGEIGRALRVANVIEGSVRRSGTKVRITVQLINAADGYHRWSHTFDREMTDIFAVQDEIAAEVSRQLSGSLPAARDAAGAPTAPPTRNIAAYDAYLRARHLQLTAGSETTLATVHAYEEALRLDPNYPVAWAQLSQVCALAYGTGFDRSEEMADKARTAVAAALRLDAHLPEAHFAQAVIRQYLDHNPGEARSELDLVEKLRPNDAEVPALRFEMAYSNLEPAANLAALARRAAAADPQNGNALVTFGRFLSGRHYYADAERYFDQAAEAGVDRAIIIREKANNLEAWTGDIPGALKLLETTPEAARGSTRFFFQRAALRDEQEEWNAAIEDYEQYRTSARQYGNRSGPRSLAALALYQIARDESLVGRKDRAARDFSATLDAAALLSHDFPELATTEQLRARVYAHLGQRTAAQAALEKVMLKAEAVHRPLAVLHGRYLQAQVMATLGEVDESIATLKALVALDFSLGYSLRLDPELAPLTSDPRFQQLARSEEATADAVRR